MLKSLYDNTPFADKITALMGVAMASLTISDVSGVVGILVGIATFVLILLRVTMAAMDTIERIKSGKKTNAKKPEEDGY